MDPDRFHVTVCTVLERLGWTPSARHQAGRDAAVASALGLRTSQHAPGWDRLGTTTRRMVHRWAATGKAA